MSDADQTGVDQTGVDQAGKAAPVRRSAKRRRIVKGAWLVMGDGETTIYCVVRDISATGARVKLSETTQIDGRLRLTLSDGETLDAEVVRHVGEEIGIRFTEGDRPSLAPPPGPLEELLRVVMELEIEDVLERLDSLGLSQDEAIAQTAEAMHKAHGDLVALLGNKVGPW
ncbi:PilZ domain-containing protein [Roseospira visakhapatnamensis]|uniref:PilZ domain-containing protein n=1 Tax=Roseospira visakhapatnamensis TaxID=390880 RepID=A0A7W6WBP4_9PROT|nr:PilZ domain-containing protein [Roseospira visakhapatnamensis]MBB4268038.1 hypothetical protein [Roseospira visakhapatnamensis]